jgi:integrase/recombinase XerD
MNTPYPTISSVVPSFCSSARADQSLRPASIEKYREASALFVRTVGDLPVDQITVETIRQLKQQLLERGSGPSHINSLIYAIRKILQHCRDSLGLDLPDLAVRTMKIPRRAVTHLTADELDRFVSAIRVHRRNGTLNIPALCFRTLVEVLAGSGMRISEALALDVPTIDWGSHEARIVGKGGKERKVFFSERAIRWMKRYLENRSDRQVPLFVSARFGRRLAQHEAQRMCRVTARRCGLQKKVTLHVLRHTFATTLLRNGCPIGHIQGLLGHERLETTCRYYLGLLSESDLKKAHERFLEW